MSAKPPVTKITPRTVAKVMSHCYGNRGEFWRRHFQGGMISRATFYRAMRLEHVSPATAKFIENACLDIVDPISH